MSEKDQNLDLEKVKDLTLEEAVQKSEELQVGITDEDGVLDKFIKKNREQIEAQKFENLDLDNLDTDALDKFIQKQKNELTEAGVLSEELESLSGVTENSEVGANPEELAIVGAASDQADVFAQMESEETAVISDDEEDEDILAYGENPKSKRVLFSALAGAMVLILGTAFGLNYFNQSNNQKATSSSASSSQQTTTSSQDTATVKKDKEAFDKLYDSFFTDSSKKALKNSEFDKLPDLKKALEKLEGTGSHADAKKQYDSLAKQIKAIQDVNALFETDAITDGVLDESAVPKESANFNTLSSSLLNTGNADLDSLIQSAVSPFRKSGDTANQEVITTEPSSNNTNNSDNGNNTAVTGADSAANQTANSGATAGVTDAQTVTQATTEVTSVAATEQVTAAEAAVSGTEAGSNVSAATNYGITNYSVALERNRSRVAYDYAAIADINNPAWAFNPGVLERILETSRARGYIVGNDFILERVAIVNGNGYYNLFKPDGTYLFTLNAKTGYFVGNAPGHSDALDF